METRTAIVFGITGLIGKSLFEELCNSDRYSVIKIFVRSKTEYSRNNKIEEHIIDFNNLTEYSDLIKGDDLFICLGTTIKKAGSIKKMEEIDRDLPIKISSIASANKVEKMAIVSSIGANPDSSNSYLRIKGEMERGISDMNFKTLAIVRPSILLGDRKEKRIGEEIGKAMIIIFGVILFGNPGDDHETSNT